jgi:hypothetical protein
VADRHHAGAILITQRQVEQHVLKFSRPTLASFSAMASPTPLSAVTDTCDSSVMTA